MATRIFRVDLSEGQGDFTASATEPGLAMLDRQGANFGIMQRWFGPLVAEPSWQGSSVNFYIQAEGGGRLDNVECHPVSKEDLEGPLKEQLMQIQARIKRAKPEEAAEMSLHRVVRSTFSSLTKDLDQSDFDCYFFKYRVGRDSWKLVWAWGYQRADPLPAPSVICTNSDCNLLFVRRPNKRLRCPGCEVSVSPHRSGVGGLVSPRTGGIAIGLLLVLLAVLFYMLGRPQLVVQPAHWAGPLGSRVEYKVFDKSWFIFNTDVTDKIVPVSGDPRVIDFDRLGVTGRARGQGRASVTFQYQNRAVSATAVVGPPGRPDRLVFALKANQAEVAVGATKQLKVWGEYNPDKNGKAIDPVDFTDLITQWGLKEEKDAGIAQSLGGGKFEGIAQGTVIVRAVYGESPDKLPLIGETKLAVLPAEYKQLKLKLDPALVRRGESARIELTAVDANGKEHSLTGSSRVTLSVEPKTAAQIDGDYVVGKAAGKASLKAKLGDLSASFPFEVSRESIVPTGTFVVRPSELNMAVDEYFELEVVTPDDAPVTLESSDPKVVKVFGDRGLEGVANGEAKVTVKQGDKSQVVAVKVNATIQDMRIDPPLIALRAGQSKKVRVLGTVEVDGAKREVQVAPEALYWERLPKYENAALDKDKLVFHGLQPTTEPQGIKALLGKTLVATASLTVSPGASGVATLDTLTLQTDQWLAHPPILPGSRITYGGLVYDHSLGGLVVGDLAKNSPLYGFRGRLPAGAVITGIGGQDFSGMTDAQIRQYFLAHPQLVGGDVIHYRLKGSDKIDSLDYFPPAATFQEVAYRKSKVINRTDDSIQFSLDLYFDKQADYRFTDAQGMPLGDGDWKMYGPEANQTVLSPEVHTDPDDSYVFYIERKMPDGKLRTFQLNVSLKPSESVSSSGATSE